MNGIARLGPAPSTIEFGIFAGAVLLAALGVVSFDFVPILDHINLAFHEFGHPLFGLFGETLGWWGGTLGQFIFPVATTVHFLRRQQLLSAAACAIWGCENLRYVALYLGDARSQQLPLVGGGEHDWAYLLGRAGWLEHDHAIAAALVWISWSGWLAIVAIVALRWRQGQALAAAETAAAERQRVIEQARLRQRQRESDRSAD